MYDAVIIGGGLTGLAAGYKLSKEGYRVLLLEGSTNLGGLAGGFKLDDLYVERFYHHFFLTDHILLKILEEIKLNEKEIWNQTTMGFYQQGKIWRFNTPFDLLRFRPLGFFDKFRFAKIILQLRGRESWEQLDLISAKDWIIENTSRNVYDAIFRPLLKVKFGKYADRASAAWLWGRIKPRAKSRTKVSWSEVLGYLDGGFQSMVEKIRGEMDKNGAQIELGVKAKKILFKKDKIRGVKYQRAGKREEAETKIVISSIPIPEFLKISPKLPSEYRISLGKINYSAVVCACLGLKERLSDIYWLNILDDLPFGGIIEHTNFIPSSRYGGQHIVYLFNYLDLKNRIWKARDEEIVKIYLNSLKGMFPNFRTRNLEWWKVFKNAYASPIYEVGYSKYMPSPKTPLKGLYLAGIFLSYPEDRTMNISLKSGAKAAELALKELG